MISSLTIEEESGDVIFRLEKDPGSFSSKTTLRTASGEEIARCQLNNDFFRGHITVKENGNGRLQKKSDFYHFGV